MNNTKVVTGTVRLSYFHGFEPVAINGGDAKYSTAILIPKSDKATLQAINEAVDAAIDAGIGKFGGGKRPNKQAIKLPLRDGDIEKGDDPNYTGHYFLNASSKSAPKIVDRKVQPILDPDAVYSGCYARVALNFYAFNTNGNKGIAVGLGNIQLVKAGDPIGGRSKPEDDFKPLDDEDEYDYDDLPF